MNIKAEKLKLIDWIIALRDESVIEKIKVIKEHENTDWWDIISEAEREAIKQGLNDLENGKTLKHEDVKNIYGKWL
jgi:hypothetical protein